MKDKLLGFKKDYYLTFVLVLTLIPLILLSIVKISSSRLPPPAPDTIPSPHQEAAVPTTTPQEVFEPTLPPYLRLMKSVQDRREISETDKEAKNRILSPLAGKSGVLYATKNVNVEYISAPDIFQVEILTANISEAKKESVAWFMSQGASLDGMCKLPVQFFLNRGVSETLGDEAATFSPLPDGC